MKKIVLYTLLVSATSLFALTNNPPKTNNDRVVAYNNNYYPAKPSNQKQNQDQNQTQHQVTNIKIIVTEPKVVTKKVITKGCVMSNEAPIAPYIDNY